MKTNAIIGAVALILGLVVGGFSGALLERRSNDERTAAAVESEAARGAAALQSETARAGRLEAEVSALHGRADLQQIHLRLGRIAMEAERLDYGAAGERATGFFDDLARMADKTAEGAEERAALEHVLAARDELIAGLATAKPAASRKLRQLYLELFDTMHQSPLDGGEAAHEASRGEG